MKISEAVALAAKGETKKYVVEYQGSLMYVEDVPVVEAFKLDLKVYELKESE